MAPPIRVLLPPQVNFMCEIPKGVTGKLEVQKKVPHNPIMQDTKKGKLRYYTYGPTFFNYGMLPRTWEDPAKKGFNGTVGDNDPLDVMEIGSRTYKVGEMRKVKILGDLELIDQGQPPPRRPRRRRRPAGTESSRSCE